LVDTRTPGVREYSKQACRRGYKARLTGRKTPSILHYQRAVDALLKLVHLYPDYKLNKIYTLPLHYFYFYMQGEQAVRGLAKSYVVV